MDITQTYKDKQKAKRLLKSIQGKKLTNDTVRDILIFLLKKESE